MQVPKPYWDDAILTECYLINRAPSSILDEKSLFSILYPSEEPFSLTPRVFRYLYFVHLLGSGRDKLSSRSVRCIFLEYSRIQKGYRCYDPLSKWHFVSVNVSYFETTPFFFISFESSSILLPPIAPSKTSIAPSSSTSTPPPLQIYSRRGKRAPPSLPSPPVLSCPSEFPTSHLSGSELPIALWKNKRPSTLHPISTSMTFDYLLPSFRSFVGSLSSISIPKTYQEVQSDPRWRQTMDEEMNALVSRGTWKLVSPLSGVHPVAYRWVFTVKYQPDSTVEHFKAHLVTKGYTQIYGIDYFEIFFPVAHLNSIRILFSIVIN